MPRSQEITRGKRTAARRTGGGDYQPPTIPTQPDAEQPPASDSGMETRSVLVTPDMAAKHLDIEMPEVNGRQLRQRHLNMDQVKRWSTLMRRGEFYESPQGVVFAPNGAVLDGMHRLMAIVDAGLPQLMRVTYHCPPELFTVFDVGNRRSAANILQIAGELNAHQLASALKLLTAYMQWLRDPAANGNWRGWNRLRPENAETERILTRHSAMRDVVTSYTSMAVRCGIVPSAMCVFVYIVQTAWPSRAGLKTLDQFLTEIDEGEGLTRGVASHTAREWFFRNRRVPMDAKRERHLLVLLQAWNRYARDQECRQLTVGDKYQMQQPYQPKTKGGRSLLELLDADTV